MKHMVYPKAIAKLRGGKDFPQLRGTVRFFQRSDGTMIEAEVEGLPQTQTGFFAFHIHAGGNCGGEDFSNSGSHFNPGGTAHPNHAGDLPPLLSDHGKAYLKVLSGRFRVEEVIGKTVIIHSDPDDFHTQPAGNPGKKIACGVIQRS
ncbi:MAG: superoxide dismutase family protein [Faecousia sp.]